MEEKQTENLKPWQGNQSGLTFSLSVVFPVIVSLVFFLIVMAVGNYNEDKGADWFTYLSYVMAQLGLIIPAFILFGIRKESVFKYAGIKKFNPKILLLLPLVSFGTIFGLGFSNDYFLKLLELIGLKTSGVSIPLENAGGLVLSLFIIALLPAVVEEIFFRGYILNGIKGEKKYISVLLCGFAFCLYHHSPAQTVYQFLMGCVFAYVALESGSIIPTMILHFVNNAFVLIFTFIAGKDYVYAPTVRYILIACGIVALVAAYLLYRFLFKKPAEKEGGKGIKGFFLFGSVGIVVALVEWGLTLI